MSATQLTPVTDNYAHLAALFSAGVLNKLVSDGAEVRAKRIVRQSRLLSELYEENISLQELFSSAYELLKRNYRSEYIYKNSLVKSILQQRHILQNSFIVPEFNVGLSKADLAVFNGTSTVYEIKSDLDNTAKLNRQLASYLEVFDKVFLVTHQALAIKVREHIDRRVGILLLDSNCLMSTYRPAVSNKAYTNPSSIFGCMRRNEYNWVLQKLLSWSPNVSRSQMVTACNTLFSELPARTAHDYFVKAIVANRKLSTPQISLINRSPASLKMFAVSRIFSQKECSLINRALKNSTII